MWQAIIEAISKLFGLSEQMAENKGAKIPLQENAIRERSDTSVVRELRKQDRIQDRQLLKTPKILYYYESYDEYVAAIAMKDNERPLYYGDKEGILKDIRQDLGKILSNGLQGQQRLFKKLVKKSDKPWFVLKIHPLTQHGK